MVPTCKRHTLYLGGRNVAKIKQINKTTMYKIEFLVMEMLVSHVQIGIIHTAKRWNQPKCPLTGKWPNKMWCSIKQNYIQLKKVGKPDKCYKNDEPCGHYTKWLGSGLGEAIHKRQIWDYCIYMRSLE